MGQWILITSLFVPAVLEACGHVRRM